MQEEGRGVKIAHFSFANAQRDGQLGCSPKERLVAIYRFFAWASQEGVHIIGCTEGHRSQNDMDWTSVLKYIKEKWGYDLVSSALLGDQSSMSFGSWLFSRLPVKEDTRSGSLTLTPKEVDGTRWVIRAPTLESPSYKLIYCHLSLSRDGTDAAYDNLVYELEQLVPLIENGWIAFGDFNLTQEVRQKLYKEKEALMKSLQFVFGSRQKDLSFVTFPHDRVPLSAFTNAPDAILNQSETGCNCVAPLDAVCGQTSLVKECRRFLPWTPFMEIPMENEVMEVVTFLKSEQGKPPSDVCDWVSDHWIIVFSTQEENK